MKPTRILSLSDAYRSRLRERLELRSRKAPGGCIEWTGSVDRCGYGKIKVVAGGTKRTTGAHRASWLAHRGDIAGSLVLDHLCRNPLCINVDHLELVTNAENLLRGDHSGKKGKGQCRKHGREDGYLGTWGGYTRWVCRICSRANSAAHRARRRGTR